jgi:ABC-2 type transport system ATP-binding protein
LITQLLGDGILPSTEPGSVNVKLADAKVAADVLGALSRASIPFVNFSLGEPSLDDVFFALTGRPAEEKAGENGKEEAQDGKPDGKKASKKAGKEARP